MKEHPIIFSTEMVKAILQNWKTQTRRVIKQQPKHVRWCPVQSGRYDGWEDEHGKPFPCPYGIPGDRLWVRETFAIVDNFERDRWNDPGYPIYKADGETPPYKWTPSIHMPRWASRLTLEIVNVRVERVQEISKADAIAEGLERDEQGFWFVEAEGNVFYNKDPRSIYAALWDKLNAKRGYGWDVNPLVWVIEFQKVSP
jgi:hypothetical protein